jgi:hypothetical protein
VKSFVATNGRWILAGLVLVVVGLLVVTGLGKKRGTRLYRWRVGLWVVALALMGGVVGCGEKESGGSRTVGPKASEEELGPSSGEGAAGTDDESLEAQVSCDKSLKEDPRDEFDKQLWEMEGSPKPVPEGWGNEEPKPGGANEAEIMSDRVNGFPPKTVAGGPEGESGILEPGREQPKAGGGLATEWEDGDEVANVLLEVGDEEGVPISYELPVTAVGVPGAEPGDGHRRSSIELPPGLGVHWGLPDEHSASDLGKRADSNPNVMCYLVAGDGGNGSTGELEGLLGKSPPGTAPSRGMDSWKPKKKEVVGDPEVRTGKATAFTGGKMDASKLDRYIRVRAPAFLKLYKSVLKKSPEAGGALVLKVRIDLSGRATARVVEDATGAPQLSKKVISKMKGWAFPKPKGDVGEFKLRMVFRTR